MQELNCSVDARVRARSMARMSLMWWSLWRTTMYAVLLVAMVGTHLQGVNGQAPAPSPTTFDDCQGAFLTYNVTRVEREYPYLQAGDPRQPYRFEAAASISNQGYNTPLDWQMYIQYNHSEVLVSLSNAEIFSQPGNGTILTGSPLQNAISTAGDLTQIEADITIVGTEFGSDGITSWPLPLYINLTNSGYNCSTSSISSTFMSVCCAESPSANETVLRLDESSPPETGDITISYDVVTAYTANYFAKVTILNNSPFRRLDNWNLSWEWQEGEFINTIQGAQTLSTDTASCVFGVAEQQYASGSPDVNSAASCDKRPQIMDLPPGYYNTTQGSLVGGVPFCCHNGTLLPAIIDSSQAKSVFTMNVYKVNPYLNATHLDPPTNFALDSGNQTGEYTCGAPQLVAPSQFPTPGVVHTTSALKSWQVACNYTNTSPKKCCVSFSTYTSNSIVPCKTYACGAPATPPPTTCNATAPALLLPYGALTIPPDNRTAQLVAWADINHWPVPSPLPCEDNCGVNINWHIVSNYTTGWSARMSVFDWSTTTFPNWFVAVDLGAAGAGFQNAYSFNATMVPQLNDTWIFQGVKGDSDYLRGTQGVYGASNYSYGIQQSVIGFTTPNGISMDMGYGFPQKVWFNGEECVMPDIFPTSGGALHLIVPKTLGVFLLALFVFTMGLVL